MNKSAMNKIKFQYPNVKESTILNKYDLYCQQVFSEYITSIVQRRKLSTKRDNLYQFDLTNISNKLGVIKNGPRWSTVFEQTMPLYTVIEKGNQHNKHLSHVKLDERAFNIFLTVGEKISMFSLEQFGDYREKVQECVDNYKHIEWLYTKIDLNSLQGYLEVQTKKLSDGMIKLNGKYVPLQYTLREKIQDELMYAMLIKEIALENDGHLPQVATQSKAGRFYYSGVNLQNCPKGVRTAALGECIQYDVNASSYAIMLNEVRKICAENSIPQNEVEKGFSQVYHYVRERKAQRKMLVTDINASIDEINANDECKYELYHVTEEQVKTAFTSIGFGSRASNSSWNELNDNNSSWKSTALRKTFGMKETTQLFLDHWFVRGFLSQVADMRKVIYNHYAAKNNNFEVVEGFPWTPKDIRKQKPSKSEALAHIYQGLESEMMLTYVSNLDQHGLLVLIHDGFICEKPINANTKAKVMEDLDNPYLNLTKEHKDAYTQKSTKADEIQAHRHFIATQEQLAEDYASDNIETDDIDVNGTRLANKEFIEKVTKTKTKRYGDDVAKDSYDAPLVEHTAPELTAEQVMNELGLK